MFGVYGILEKVISVHKNSVEDNFLFDSWGQRRPRIGGRGREKLRKVVAIGMLVRTMCRNISRFGKVLLFRIEVSINNKRKL